MISIGLNEYYTIGLKRPHAYIQESEGKWLITFLKNDYFKGMINFIDNR